MTTPYQTKEQHLACIRGDWRPCEKFIQACREHSVWRQFAHTHLSHGFAKLGNVSGIELRLMARWKSPCLCELIRLEVTSFHMLPYLMKTRSHRTHRKSIEIFSAIINVTKIWEIYKLLHKRLLAANALHFNSRKVSLHRRESKMLTWKPLLGMF